MKLNYKPVTHEVVSARPSLAHVKYAFQNFMNNSAENIMWEAIQHPIRNSIQDIVWFSVQEYNKGVRP